MEVGRCRRAHLVERAEDGKDDDREEGDDHADSLLISKFALLAMLCRWEEYHDHAFRADTMGFIVIVDRRG